MQNKLNKLRKTMNDCFIKYLLAFSNGIVAEKIIKKPIEINKK